MRRRSAPRSSKAAKWHLVPPISPAMIIGSPAVAQANRRGPKFKPARNAHRSVTILDARCFWSSLHGQGASVGSLAEAANDEIVTVGTVQSKNTHDRRTFCGIDNLANAQKCFAFRDRKKLRGSRIRGGGIDFFVGVAKFDVEFALERCSQ